jgi:hypothetical protein
LYKNRARNPTATRTQNRTQIRIQFGALQPKESKNDISPHLHYSRLYLILQITRHSTHPCFKHYSSSRQMPLWAIALVVKCLSGKMSFWANVFLGKCPLGQMSSGQIYFWANVLLGKHPSRQTSSGQMYFWANVFLGKHRLGKRIMGKWPSGQMSFWANVFWADVFWANAILGKYLFADVSGQMSYGQISCHPQEQSVNNPIANYFVQGIVLVILHQFIRRITRVDRP